MQTESIAIIGMAGIFPKAENLNQYWNNILQSIDCITDIPETHWSVADYYDPDPKVEDKTYCKRGGFIPAIDFNPLEFGLPPNILENIDVAQLLSLVVAKRALQDASYGELNPYASTTGVTLGVSALSSLTGLTSRLQYPIWEKVLTSAGIEAGKRQEIINKIKLAYAPWREDSFPGYLSNVVAGRIANRLNLGGVNCSIDAACASSMAALQMAIDELVLKRSDMMITGGVDLNNGISAFVSFSKTPAFTQHPNMRPFDNESDGMLIGEGIGMLVLRRLADAKRDGNKVYAIIRGVGSSSDGKHKSIYAPSVQGQELALKRAYLNAGVAPDTIGLLEAHGTGTATGDPAESSALHTVFGEANVIPASIALGSVKSQIGHTKVAAGVAGMIKTALALYHKILPPTINITNPSAKLNMESSPFYLNTTARPWFSSTKRRAGVSAFGFGGTNFHAVLEEESELQTINNGSNENPPYQIILHANSPAQLLEFCVAKRAQLLNAPKGEIFLELCKNSVNLNISPNAARIGFLAIDENSFVKQLEAVIDVFLENPNLEQFNLAEDVYYRATAWNTNDKVVALFPGQGSQYLEMGKTLCWNYATIFDAYVGMDKILLSNGRMPITDIIFPKPTFDEKEKKNQLDLLQKIENTQVAVGIFNLGLFKLLQEMGFSPDLVAGNNLGELTALCAAQVISEPDYLQLLHKRGNEGNEAFVNSLQSIAFNSPKIPIYSNELINPYPQDPADIRKVYAEHLLKPVNFKQEIEQLYANGARIFIEFGPGNVLTELVDNILDGQAHTSIALNANKYQDSFYLLQNAILQMRILGLPIQVHETLGNSHVESKKIGANIQLYGSTYVSDKTKQGFVTALLNQSIESRKEEQMNQVIGKQSLEQTGDVQQNGEIPVVHQQYLKNMADHSQQFFQLVQQQYLLLNNPNCSSAILQSFERSIALFHEQQNMMQRIHEQYILKSELNADPQKNAGLPSRALQTTQNKVHEFVSQNSFSKESKSEKTLTHPAVQNMQSLEAMLNLESKDAIVVPTLVAKTKPIETKKVPELSVNDTSSSASDTGQILLTVVSEKTGYSTDMLDLSMDLDADLGIDSIKRVEILGALEGRISGDFTGLNFEKFAELRTLKQIAHYLDEAKKKVLM